MNSPNENMVRIIYAMNSPNKNEYKNKIVNMDKNKIVSKGGKYNGWMF